MTRRHYQTGAHATSTGVPGLYVDTPGHGPVLGQASAEQATKNMRRFAADVRAAVARTTNPKVTFAPLEDPNEIEYALLMGGDAGVAKGYNNGHDGRWPFRLTVEGVIHVIEMPGLPTAQVRYMGAKRQRIWDFPRVFHSGSSWTWDLATKRAAEETENYR